MNYYPTQDEILDAVALEGTIEDRAFGDAINTVSIYVDGMDMEPTQKIKMKEIMRELFEEACRVD